MIPSEVIDRPKGYFPVPALTHLDPAAVALTPSGEGPFT